MVHIASSDPFLLAVLRGFSSSTFMLQIPCPPKRAFIELRSGALKWTKVNLNFLQHLDNINIWSIKGPYAFTSTPPPTRQDRFMLLPLNAHPGLHVLRGDSLYSCSILFKSLMDTFFLFTELGNVAVKCSSTHHCSTVLFAYLWLSYQTFCLFLFFYGYLALFGKISMKSQECKWSWNDGKIKKNLSTLYIVVVQKCTIGEC